LLHTIWYLIKREIAYHRRLPTHATLDLTDSCNQRCLTCSLWQQKDTVTSLSTVQWQGILSQLNQIDIKDINLIGAEPLLRTDILDIIAALKANQQRGHLITNGSLLTARLATELIQVGLDSVTVSLQGPDADCHDRIVNLPGAFRQSCDGIRALLLNRQRAGRRYPIVKIHTTLHTLNIDQAEGLCELGAEIGVDSLAFQLISEPPAQVCKATQWAGVSVAGTQYLPQAASLLPRPEQITDFQRLFRRNGCRNPSLAVLSTLNPQMLAEGRFPTQRCYMIRIGLNIDPNGSIYPCGMLKNLHFGNISEGDLESVLTSEERQQFMQQLHRKRLAICDYCCHFYTNISLTQLLRTFIGTWNDRTLFGKIKLAASHSRSAIF
jgi:radical SAM protein with 4Fe4S-binding SPASM domain